MKKTQRFSCPSCGCSWIRADVHQSCRVDIDREGDITHCFDFSEPEADEHSLYCERCGEGLEVELPDDGTSARLTKRSLLYERDEQTA